jgi:hypothetical protein
MRKSFELSDMPPLTLEMHEKLRALERALQSELGRCCSNYELIDREAAFEYARSYAVQFYDCFYAFYSEVPDPAYRPHWRLASEKHALQRVLKCIDHNSATRMAHTFNAEGIARIKRTISERSEQNPIAKFPLIGGLDATLDSPLLTMAKAAARNAQRAVFAPIPVEPASIATQLKELKLKSRLSAQKIAEGIDVDLRTVQRHLSGHASPRDSQILAYEEFFTKRLGKSIKLDMP